MSKKITKQCLIILSVLVFYPALVQADAPVTIPPNMRMSAGLHKRSDGSFCAIDPRGKSALTPSFVKPSLSAKPSIPKGMLECNAQETKAFQKKIKTAYLQTQDGAQLQKTMGGAVLGNVLKGMGMGCVFATVAQMIAETTYGILGAIRGNGNKKTQGNRQSLADPASLTEAEGVCVTCALQAFGGGIFGTLSGAEKGEKTAGKIAKLIDADVRKEWVKLEKANIAESVQKMSAADIGNNLQASQNTAKSIQKQFDKINGRLHDIMHTNGYSEKQLVPARKPGYFQKVPLVPKGLKKAMSAMDLERFNKLHQEGKVIEQKLSAQKHKVTFWEAALQARDPKVQADTLKPQIHETAVRRVSKLSTGQIFEQLPENTNKAVIQKHSKALQKLPGLTGFLSGAAGAVVCHEGMVFYLRKEDQKI